MNQSTTANTSTNPYTRAPAAYAVVTSPDTYEAVLDLEPIAADLVRAIARALARHRKVHRLVAIGNLRASEDAPAMTEVLRILHLHGALQLNLTPEPAAALAAALGEAADEPKSCDCGSFIDPTASTGTLCGVCSELAGVVSIRRA